MNPRSAAVKRRQVRRRSTSARKCCVFGCGVRPLFDRWNYARPVRPDGGDDPASGVAAVGRLVPDDRPGEVVALARLIVLNTMLLAEATTGRAVAHLPYEAAVDDHDAALADGQCLLGQRFDDAALRATGSRPPARSWASHCLDLPGVQPAVGVDTDLAVRGDRFGQPAGDVSPRGIQVSGAAVQQLVRLLRQP
jgi:hypothetical protein